MSAGPDADIDAALAKLKQLVSERVRLEQLRDQLTSLPNLAALNEAIRSRLLEQGQFWAAFVEVDRFKSINDRFGYESADALLKKIAAMLDMMCSCFPGTTNAFRAHGDEFYLLGVTTGDVPGEQVSEALDLVRRNIAAIRVPVEKAASQKRAEDMSCTVSIGWIVNADLDKQTERTILAALERAVGEAKRERNRVMRYSKTFEDDDAVSLRADCRDCGAKFSFDIKRSKHKDGQQLSCPNCHAAIERPVLPERAPKMVPETV